MGYSPVTILIRLPLTSAYRDVCLRVSIDMTVFFLPFSLSVCSVAKECTLIIRCVCMYVCKYIFFLCTEAHDTGMRLTIMHVLLSKSLFLFFFFFFAFVYVYDGPV